MADLSNRLYGGNIMNKSFVNILTIYMFIIILFLSFINCRSNENYQPQFSEHEINDLDVQYKYHNTEFAFILFKDIYNYDNSNNIVFSPLCVFLNLSILANGANNDYKNKIMDIISNNTLELNDLNKKIKYYLIILRILVGLII